MESSSDTLSLSSNKNSKKVGFTRNRPTLIIPPPQINQNHVIPISRTSGTTSKYSNNRRESVFDFVPVNGIKDVTKSGMGVGEKCAYCVYNKLRKWSRKWFTHMFLTIVLILYTIGGALIFEFIEGHAEDAVTLDLKTSKDLLLKNLRLSSLKAPVEKSLAEWIGEASRDIQQYEHKIINYYATRKLAMTRGKTWTFWNAIVFCGNIYTTIAPSIPLVANSSLRI